MCLQCIYYLCHRRRFLSDRNIDADHIFSFLVQDRVHCNRRLSRLTVSDDQLSLSAADREHCINRQDTGLHRNADRLSVNDPRSFLLDRAVTICFDLSSSVNRLAECIDDSSYICFTDRYAGFLSCAGYFRTLTDLRITSEKDTSDLIFADILDHSLKPGLECDDLSVHGVVDAIDRGDPVTY